MEKRPKILYVITQGGPWGGAQKYVRDLIISRQGNYDLFLAIGETSGSHTLQEELPQTYKNEGKIIQLKHLKRGISPMHDILAIIELARLYKKLQPTAVHLNSTKAGVLGSLASAFLGKQKPKIIYTVHGWIFNEPVGRIKQAIYSLLERYTSRWKDTIIVLSKADGESARKLGIENRKIRIIESGIQHNLLLNRDSARNGLRNFGNTITLPFHGYWIGVIANLFATKGLDILIHAFAKIKDTAPDIHIIIVGEGPEADKLKHLTSELGVSTNIHFTGFIPSAATLLLAFDLVVLPSKKEGLPYCLLEAQVAGIPIIATDVGGVGSIIKHGKNGLLIPPNNPDTLAEALLFAIKNPNDMRAMAPMSKETVKSGLTMAKETYSEY